MASVFKTFLNNDITSTRTLLHEAIPITGTILSGTYGGANMALGTEYNIKSFTHGQFQSIYDYPFLSSSSNHIFDITAGFSSKSAYSASWTVAGAKPMTQHDKKINMYTQLAQMMVGHDATGSVHQFDMDGNLVTGTKIQEAIFFNFSRLLVKDEIKKGSFSMTLGVELTGANAFRNTVNLADTNAATSFFVNSPVGEFGVLTASNGTAAGNTNGICSSLLNNNISAGLIFYQAGLAVVTASLFQTASTTDAAAHTTNDQGLLSVAALGASIPRIGFGDTPADSTVTTDISGALNNSTIGAIADGIRQRISNISFNNTTELNSTVYFCRIGHNEFNYSSNPTYLNGNKIRIKNEATDAPRAYITTIGLYSADNELLAVAKLSEPIRKDPTNELTLRVRLDY